VACEGYHSELPAAERRRVWDEIAQGRVRVVVGTRSACLLPLTNLGLIIVDHEDHPAYKAQNSPRYDTRELAGRRGRQQQAVVVLASAHPSLYAVYATGDAAGAGASPAVATAPVKIANLRESPGEILSPSMITAMNACMSAGQRILLYINRKGYASVLLCRDCGEAIRCPSCKLGWNFHKRERMLSCGHCGLRAVAPGACPACRGVRLFPTGFGTEAVEEAVKSCVPHARVARLERTRGRKKQEDADVLSRFMEGQCDVLVGTQLAVSSTPRPSAALVGVIVADAALHLPDFLAAERAYHLLREVISLADADSPHATVILQTYMPEHHVIRALAARSPRMFYQNELMARAALGYPPFGQLIALRISGTQEDRVAAAAKRWAVLLRTQAYADSTSARFELLGPIPAVPARLRGRFRWQLVLKGVDGALLRHAVRTTLDTLEGEGHTGHLRYDIDVDPQSLLN
jgi:primosomal protein N' (replication factor Y) (superfamily II helicase)